MLFPTIIHKTQPISFSCAASLRINEQSTFRSFY